MPHDALTQQKFEPSMAKRFQRHIGRLFLLLFLSTSIVKPALALDGQQAGQIASSLGSVMMGVAAVDAVGSVGDCACMVSGPPCPKGVAGMCAMLGLNIAAAIAALIPTKSGSDAANALNGDGAFDPTDFSRFDPNIPLATQLNCPAGSPACDCSGPGAQSNILCGKASIENVKASLAFAKDKLNAGSIDIPEGQNAESLLDSINNASSSLDSLLAGKIPGAETGSIGDSLGGAKQGGAGKYSAVGASDIGSFDFAASETKGKAGPADRSGLGRVIGNGGLDLLDEATGKSLTIWQRSTRRYQGDANGSRAFLLAKVEAIRKQALTPAPSLTNKPAPKTPSTAKATVLEKSPTAPAVRSPASKSQISSPNH